MIRHCPFALLLAVGMAPIARANPTQELLRSVPPESTICFVAQDWSTHSQRIAASPFLVRLKESDLGQSLLNPDAMGKIFALESVLTDALHLSVGQLRDDILGDAIVYAYQPGQPGKPDDDSGILLVKARNAKTLAKLVDNFNGVQKESGELKTLTEIPLGKLAYFHRELTDGTDEYFFVREGVFAFSKNERSVKQVLALGAAPPKAAPFLDAYNRLGLMKPALAAIFQPRLLDGDLRSKITATPNDHAKAFLKQFARIWSSTNAIAIALDLGTDVELALHVSFDPTTLPAELKPFLGESTASSVWSSIPKEAIFALAGRLDLPQLLSLGKSFLSDPGLKGLKELVDNQVAPAVGKDALPDLLKSIGPDWGIWLTAPGKTSRGPLPDLTVALRVRNPESRDNSLGDAVRLGLSFAFQMFRVEYNKSHDDQFTIREVKDEAGPIQHLENAKLLPKGVRPAFAQRGDFLVLATSPEAIQRFDPKKDAPKADAALFLRIGWVALEQYLRNHGEEFAKFFAAGTGKNVGDLLKEFRELQQIVELLDNLELRQSGTIENTKWTLKLKLVAPLMK